MSEFYAEVAEKSRIARGARHKVNGSKSKRVSLSSDRMRNVSHGSGSTG